MNRSHGMTIQLGLRGVLAVMLLLLLPVSFGQRPSSVGTKVHGRVPNPAVAALSACYKHYASMRSYSGTAQVWARLRRGPDETKIRIQWLKPDRYSLVFPDDRWIKSDPKDRYYTENGQIRTHGPGHDRRTGEADWGFLSFLFHALYNVSAKEDMPAKELIWSLEKETLWRGQKVLPIVGKNKNGSSTFYITRDRKWIVGLHEVYRDVREIEIRLSDQKANPTLPADLGTPDRVWPP